MMKEEQRVKMRAMKPQQKWMTIQAQMTKETSQQQQNSIAQVVMTVRTKQSVENLQSLRVQLNQADDSALQQFLDANGVQLLLEVVNTYTKKPTYAIIILQYFS